ncbi:MAG: PIN domain-containing protein [Anaerolineales bacterium]|nr:PIN domain-containing protein [Chloroflexota bacterium]MBL6983750.1 PIN domain-containing protein [Anaerolineales bacterium]
MSAKFFIDTNIFVYTFDNNAPAKKACAIDVVQQAINTGSGVISTQVIQEFLNVATRKFAVPMKLEDSKMYLQQVLNPLCQIYPDLELYEACLEIQDETGYSFYDSLIISAAIKGECEILYTEDLQTGQMVRGVEISNPFSEL